MFKNLKGFFRQYSTGFEQNHSRNVRVFTRSCSSKTFSASEYFCWEKFQRKSMKFKGFCRIYKSKVFARCTLVSVLHFQTERSICITVDGTISRSFKTRYGSGILKLREIFLIHVGYKAAFYLLRKHWLHLSYHLRRKPYKLLI